MKRTKKKRVLVIGPFPPPFAGPEMAIKNLLESPIKDDFNVSHLSTNVRKSNADKGKVNAKLFLAFFQFFFRLIGRLIKFRPHVVYYFVTATRMGWLGRDVWCIAISRLFGAKVVTHMRAGHFKYRLGNAKKWEVGLIRWACHRVAWSLVQAPSLRDQFQDLAPDDRIKVVPNMINIDRYPIVPSEDRMFGKILILGHLSVAKGYCELLKSIPHVARKYPNVSFEFAGTKKTGKDRNVQHIQSTGKPLPDDDPEEVFRDNIEGKFDANYVYLGVLDEKEKIVALRECDFLVQPSFSEGFSMAVLEALAMGKPVVCTAVGAMRDFVVDGVNGVAVEPGDTKALTQAIKKLLGDRELRDKLAKENGNYVRRNFSQEAIASRLGDLFYKAMS